jgi:hypothetical protein
MDNKFMSDVPEEGEEDDGKSEYHSTFLSALKSINTVEIPYKL